MNTVNVCDINWYIASCGNEFMCEDHDLRWIIYHHQQPTQHNKYWLSADIFLEGLNTY